MTLHQLKVFVAVAKFKSFSLAGEELRLRQPSVSIAVRGLERDLEVKLFEHLGRKVLLTRAGEELVRIAEEILPTMGGIKEKLAEIEGLKKGKIAVGGSAIAGASFLPLAVERFKNEYPEAQIILKIERSGVLEKKLLDGELDLAILSRIPDSPLLVGGLYREEEIVVIAPPKHPLTKRRVVPLELLAKERLITAEKGTLMWDMVERGFTEKGFAFTPRLAIDVRFGGRDAIRTAVAGGLGISFMPRCHIEGDIKAGRLKLLNVPELALKRSMYVTIHKRRRSSCLVKEFLDFLQHSEELRAKCSPRVSRQRIPTEVNA